MNGLPFLAYVMTYDGHPTDAGDLASLVLSRHAPPWVTSLSTLLDWLDEQAAPRHMREVARELHREWIAPGW
jgi:hypothetical protein